MTASDIISDARRELKDVEPFRWSDTLLLPVVSEGQIEIAGRRPDALYVTEIVTTMPIPLSSTADALSISEFFRMALVFFVCARVLQMDQENAANLSAATNYLNLFGALLK